MLARAPLGAVVRAEVLPRVVGTCGMVAAVVWPQPRSVGLRGASSSRMPKTSTLAPRLPQLQHCWVPGGAELWLLRPCQALGTVPVHGSQQEHTAGPREGGVLPRLSCLMSTLPQ